jgi:hypothetical protein
VIGIVAFLAELYCVSRCNAELENSESSPMVDGMIWNMVPTDIYPLQLLPSSHIK